VSDAVDVAVEASPVAEPQGEPTPVEKMEARIAELSAEEGAGDNPGEASPAKAKELTPEQEESERLTKGQKFLAKTHAQKLRLKADREEFNANKRAFDAQVGGFTEKLKASDALERLRVLAGTDPIAALEELGIDYADVTRRVLSKDTPEGDRQIAVKEAKLAASEEVKALRAELEAERAQARYAQAFSSFMSTITPDSTPEASILLKSEGQAHIKAVAEEIDAKLTERQQKTGQKYSVEDITDYLEQHAKVVNTKRREAYGLVPGAETGLEKRATPSALRGQARTLTNRSAAETSRGTDDLSDEDRESAAKSILRTLSKR